LEVVAMLDKVLVSTVFTGSCMAVPVVGDVMLFVNDLVLLAVSELIDVELAAIVLLMLTALPMEIDALLNVLDDIML